MTEQSEIRLEDELFRDARFHLAVLVESTEPSDDPVVHARLLVDRKIAITNIAENLIDPKNGDVLARFMTTNHNSDPSLHLSVYAYWSVLRKIMTDAPTATIPIEFLNFFQDMALKADEPEMEFTAKMMAANIQELESADTEPTTVSVLVGMSRAARIQLDDLYSRSQERLNKSRTEANARDAKRIAASIGNPDDLLRDIQNNQFFSLAGMVAARTQQDNDRLVLRTADPKNLLEDITNGNFVTKEGLRTAKLQQDSDRLTFRQDDSTRLRGDILGSRFCTPEGIEAAKTQHDTDRLAMRSRKSDFDGLLGDIRNQFFFTTKSLADALIQQDADRLAQHIGNIGHLQSDLWANRFLTDEGIERAQAVIDGHQY